MESSTTHHPRCSQNVSAQDLLNVEVFPTEHAIEFPEQSGGYAARYAPVNKPFGVALSGGGMRALVAGWGQLRALQATGTLEYVGALSCVSGGTWCGTLFTFADAQISDPTLLGPVTEPEDLTLTGIGELDPHALPHPVTNLSNARLIEAWDAWQKAQSKYDLPDPKWIASMVDWIFLRQFWIPDESAGRMRFSLDGATVDAIVAQNPNSGLDATMFYVARESRPFFIAGTTLNYNSPQPPPVETPPLRQIEITPLYVGSPLKYPNQGKPNGVGGFSDLGYGYVQPCGFNTDTPSGYAKPYATVAIPAHPFQLADVMACSGDAPGQEMDVYGLTDATPQFSYWPVRKIGASNERAVEYSFVDGGSLEDTGIVSLVRRGYPIVLAFINTEFAFGVTTKNYYDSRWCYDGIDGQVSRLFGFRPPKETGEPQSTQLFASEGFAALQEGFQAAKAAKGPIIHGDLYEIFEGNPFGIPKSQGPVAVVWFYNSPNPEWLAKLPTEISDYMADPTNDLTNLPNYSFVEQYGDEIFQLSTEQVNLLADHCCYAVTSKTGPMMERLRELRPELSSHPALLP